MEGVKCLSVKRESEDFRSPRAETDGGRRAAPKAKALQHWQLILGHRRRAQQRMCSTFHCLAERTLHSSCDAFRMASSSDGRCFTCQQRTEWEDNSCSFWSVATNMEQSSTIPVRVCPQKKARLSLFFLHDPRAMFEARPSTRSLSPKTSMGTSLTLGQSGMAHCFPEIGGCPGPFSTVSGHPWKAHAQTCSGFCESSGMLRSRMVSAQLQRTKPLSTARQVPHFPYHGRRKVR